MFIDAKERKFRIAGVWWQKRYPHIVEFYEIGSLETKSLLYLDLKILFDKGLLIHWDV